MFTSSYIQRFWCIQELNMQVQVAVCCYHTKTSNTSVDKTLYFFFFLHIQRQSFAICCGTFVSNKRTLFIQIHYNAHLLEQSIQLAQKTIWKVHSAFTCNNIFKEFVFSVIENIQRQYGPQFRGFSHLLFELVDFSSNRWYQESVERSHFCCEGICIP